MPRSALEQKLPSTNFLASTGRDLIEGLARQPTRTARWTARRAGNKRATPARFVLTTRRYRVLR